MKKAIYLFCILNFIIVNNPLLATRAEIVDDEYDEYWEYRIQNITDGFRPPNGETIQFMACDMAAKQYKAGRLFQQRYPCNMEIKENAVFRIANTVKEIPCGQHHRFTLVVNGGRKQAVFWYSSNPDIAKVGLKTGELAARQVGKVKIWVTDQFGNIQDVVWLEVVPRLTQEEVNAVYISYGDRQEYNMRKKTVYWGQSNDTGRRMILPENVLALVEGFADRRLEQVRIPTSVKVVAYDTSEADTWGIRHGEKVEVSVDGNNTNYYSLFGVLFSHSFENSARPGDMHYEVDFLYTADCKKRALIFYPSEREGEVYYVPYGVERIAGRAFEGTKYLRRVVLPDTVTAIGGGAFGSMSLKELVIPSSVTEFEDNGYVDAIDIGVRNDFTIITPAGSAAEAYAIEHGIKYRNE